MSFCCIFHKETLSNHSFTVKDLIFSVHLSRATLVHANNNNNNKLIESVPQGKDVKWKHCTIPCIQLQQRSAASIHWEPFHWRKGKQHFQDHCGARTLEVHAIDRMAVWSNPCTIQRNKRQQTGGNWHRFQVWLSFGRNQWSWLL